MEKGANVDLPDWVFFLFFEILFINLIFSFLFFHIFLFLLKGGVTPLIKAVSKGRKSIVEYLLEKGANVDLPACQAQVEILLLLIYFFFRFFFL